MTREETVKIIRIMVDSYPNYKPNNISETVDVWHMMLSDYDYNLVAMALKAYILSDTNGFAPSIGQLVAKIQTLTKPQELNEMEAWSLVSNAIRNSGYNCEEEYSKLPPLIQKAVGTPSQLRTWAIDENYNEQVVSSNFIKCYKTVKNHSEEYNKMSSDIKSLIQDVIQSPYMAQIQAKKEKITNTKAKALEYEKECIPMPEELEKKWESWKNEQNKKTNK